MRSSMVENSGSRYAASVFIEEVCLLVFMSFSLKQPGLDHKLSSSNSHSHSHALQGTFQRTKGPEYI